jgi:hypothetical protein
MANLRANSIVGVASTNSGVTFEGPIKIKTQNYFYLPTGNTFKRNVTENIVENGLVLYLDAGTSTSYPGTGNTWIDLSGNGNTATMYGSVPFSTDVAPCFDFATATGADAANSSLGFTFGSNMIPTTGDFTFSCWIKNPNASTAQIGLFSNSGKSYPELFTT